MMGERTELQPTILLKNISSTSKIKVNLYAERDDVKQSWNHAVTSTHALDDARGIKPSLTNKSNHIIDKHSSFKPYHLYHTLPNSLNNIRPTIYN
uniref:SFRICE_036284 n=1 Tax=Spodoptera frugiperda TaxID=7108 RepID=A0A2H1VPE6_SPOFR